MSPTDAEVLAANWRKARISVANGACVEVASTTERVLVRDSVDPSRSAIGYAPEAWRSFIDYLKVGVPR